MIIAGLLVLLGMTTLFGLMWVAFLKGELKIPIITPGISPKLKRDRYLKRLDTSLKGRELFIARQ